MGTLALYAGTRLLLAASVFVAALEERPCHEQEGTAERMVHPLFVKGADGWRGLPSWDAAGGLALPSVWRVTFDGRLLGTLRTLPPPRIVSCPSSCDIWLQPASGQRLPEIRASKALFSGWCGRSAFRPLVLVSAPHFLDPAGWEPLALGVQSEVGLFESFRSVAGDAEVCRPGQPLPQSLPYAPGDLRVRAHRDRRGRKIVTLQIDPRLDTCDGPGGAAWEPHSFVIDRTIRHIGSGLSLVDAGDYDGDGASEIVFWFSGYNRDGYVLFDDGPNLVAETYWTYH